MSFMTEGVLTQVVFYTTSHVVWQALAIHFSSQSKTWIIHIHTQLATIKKGTHYANEYFLSIKKLTNELVVAGRSLHYDEIITYVLIGLWHDCDSSVSFIYVRIDHVTLKKVYSLLIVTEARLTCHHLSAPTPIFKADVVQRQPMQLNTMRRGGSHGRGQQYHGFLWGTFFLNLSNISCSTIVVCQVRGKDGHFASKCYHCFNPIYYEFFTPQQIHALFVENTCDLESDWHADTEDTHHITLIWII